MASGLPHPVGEYNMTSANRIAPSTRKKMESLFGESFASVRIIRRSSPFAAAFANGETIVVDTDVVLDDRLLAHELAHVVQQRRAAELRDCIGDPDDEFETEAE